MRCDFQALPTGQEQHHRIGGEGEEVIDDGPALKMVQEQQDSHKASSLINDNSQANCGHVCRYCKRAFSSGRALGGHMRAHGSVGFVAANLDGVTDALQDTADKELTNVESGGGSSSSRIQSNTARFTGCRDEERRSADLHQKFKGSSRDTVSKWEQGEAISTRPDTIFNMRNCCCVADANTDVLPNVDEREGKKVHPLYVLRRNPKRSRRFIDQDFTLEVIPPPPLAKKTSAMFLENARACTECGKEFSSWKALFGHMRCHPEREWRGIQPPNNIARQESVHQPLKRKKKSMTGNSATFEGISELGSDDIGTCKVLDEESDNESIEAAYVNGEEQRNIYGWMTGKRSKRSRQAVRSLQAVTDRAPELIGLTTPTDVKEERDMANCLVMLAFAGGSTLEAEKIDINRGATDESTFSGPQSKESSAAAEEDGKIYGKEGEEDTSRRLDDRMSESRSVEYYIEQGVIWDRGGGGAEPRVRFRCSTCKRSFGSHQALGGHRASHKKVKGCFARTNTGAEEMVSGVEERPHATEFYHFLCRNVEEGKVMKSIYHQQGAIATERREEENEMNELILGSSLRKAKSHQCSICQRVFSTGQALGGHKRCHWGGGDKATSFAVFGQVNRTSTNLIYQSEQQQQQEEYFLHHHMRPISAAAGDQVVSRSLKDDQLLDLNLPAPAEEDEDFQSGMASVCSQKL